MRIKKFLLSLLFLSFLISPALAYDTDHWAYQDLEELRAKNIIQEKTNAEKFLTRADFTEMLVKALEIPEIEKLAEVNSPFKDLSFNDRQKKYIISAWEQGLVGGYSENEFRPKEELRRDQMIVLLLRNTELKSKPQVKLDFIDKKSIPDYALNSIANALELGLVKGYEDKSFRPAQKVTWAEASSFLNRFLDLRGERYNYSGRLESISPQSISLQIAGETISLNLPKNCPIFKDSQKIASKDLKNGETLGLFVKADGQVALIQVLSKGENIQTEKKTEIKTKKKAVEELEEEIKDKPKKKAEKDKIQVAASFSPRYPLSDEMVTESLESNKRIIELEKLRQKHKSSGKNIKIAVIDSGIDPKHPDLQKNLDGSKKILEWVDLTDEGKVKLVAVEKIGQDYLSHQGEKFFIGTIPSLSDKYYLGRLAIKNILPEKLKEEYRLTKNEPKYLDILVTDGKTKGVFDTVYLDHNFNKNFFDEEALEEYNQSQKSTSIKICGRDLSLLITNNDKQGGNIQISSDLLGHGTHVAGTIGANGRIQGVAPNAELLSVKVVKKDGLAAIKDIASALEYSAQKGADIINISLGQYGTVNKKLNQIVTKITKEYGSIVVVAAGNIGPALSSTSSPADSKDSISVGAFVSKEMWEQDFGYLVDKDTMYFFSSRGPNKNGDFYPLLAAPGSCISTVPLWMDSPHMATEGTSMAAPHVSGSIAHLLELAEKNKLKVSPEQIKFSLIQGAVKKDSSLNIDIGHGLLDVNKAWEILKEKPVPSKIEKKFLLPKKNQQQGLYERDYLPRQLELNLKNSKNKDYLLEWNNKANWLDFPYERTYVPKNSERKLKLNIKLPEEAGLYHTVLRGIDQERKDLALEIPFNILQGLDLEKNKMTKSYTDSLRASEIKRYYFKVPEGTGEIWADLEVLKNSQGQKHGSMVFILTSPSQKEELFSSYVGLSPLGLEAKDNQTLSSYLPEAGIWEVIVYSSEALSELNIFESNYRLEVGISNIQQKLLGQKTDDLLLTPAVPSKLKTDKSTINIWDKTKKQPYQGYFQIDDELYSIKKGQLEIDQKALKHLEKKNYSSIRE